MKRRVVYAPAAVRDLEAAYRYISRDNPSAAAAWLDRVDEALARLSDFPLSGRAPKDRVLRRRGYRVLVIGDHLAFHLVRPQRVEVRRVVHGRRRYPFVG